MRAALPAHSPLPQQLNARLIDELGGLQSLAGSLAPQIAVGQSVDLRVDERDQLLERARVTVAPRLQQLRNVTRWLLTHR